MYELNRQAQAAFDRLGWAIDRRDWAAVTAALGTRVRLDYTEVFGGEPTTTSGQDVADQWRGTLGGLAATQHVITGAQATEGDAGTLVATANVVGTHVRAGDPPWVIGGWYEAILEPADDGYAVAALTLHPSWETGSKDVLGS